METFQVRQEGICFLPVHCRIFVEELCHDDTRAYKVNYNTDIAKQIIRWHWSVFFHFDLIRQQPPEHGRGPRLSLVNNLSPESLNQASLVTSSRTTFQSTGLRRQDVQSPIYGRLQRYRGRRVTIHVHSRLPPRTSDRNPLFLYVSQNGGRRGDCSDAKIANILKSVCSPVTWYWKSQNYTRLNFRRPINPLLHPLFRPRRSTSAYTSGGVNIDMTSSWKASQNIQIGFARESSNNLLISITTHYLYSLLYALHE